MGDATASCPHCAASLRAGTRFCGECGKSVADSTAQDANDKPLARTMMGIDASAVSSAVERAKASAPAQPDSAEPAGKAFAAKTMIGLSVQELVKPDAALPAASDAASPAASAPAEPAESTTAGNPKAFAAKTMLGLPTAAVPEAMAQVTPALAADGGTSPARTMLGGAMEDAMATSPSVAPPAPAPLGAAGGRTMLGVPLPSASTPAVSPGRASAGPQRSFVTDPGGDSEPLRSSREIDTDPALPRPKRRPVGLVAFVALLALVAAALFAMRPFGGSSSGDVSAKIVTIDSGEALLFEVPAAPAGSKIRFGGQEKPLQAGRATFALAADSLRVGDNIVLADLVHPSGDSRSTRITLAVPYRIWVDTASLQKDKSAVDVVVTALPGTRVVLDGQELKLDAEGRGTRSYPLEVVSEAKTGLIEHVVRYRVQPPTGETDVDELHTQIPVAMMQIDRPGREVVTDRDMIEIAGACGKDATITIDGVPVAVADGRFLYRLSLPNPGVYEPRVVASAAGKAPMGVTLDVRRVADLVKAASEFAADPDLTYAKLAPNSSIYRGQKIAIEGRVYATDARGADSVIQMFARPCPSSQRCSLWVVDPSGTEVAVDSFVRVFGIVEGEQQFRSEKNDVVTVPKIQARFVLPAKP